MPKLTNTPPPSTLVIVQVAKIMQFGAYCKLVEYNDIEAFLPLREISSGWIKNIHEFLHQGQNLVCKVIYIDRDKGTIDISLKKVTPKDSKVKINAYNLERRLTSIFLQAVKKAGEDRRKEALSAEVLSEFGSYTNLVTDAINATDRFNASPLPKKIKDALISILEASRKRKNREVSYIMKLSTTNTKSGITELNTALTAAEKLGVRVTYISAPQYRIEAEGVDYAEAEGKIKRAVDLVSALKDATVTIEKEKLKKERESVLDSLQLQAK